MADGWGPRHGTIFYLMPDHAFPKSSGSLLPPKNPDLLFLDRLNKGGCLRGLSRCGPVFAGSEPETSAQFGRAVPLRQILLSP